MSYMFFQNFLHNYLTMQNKTSVLYILDFPVPIPTQKELKFLLLNFLVARRITSEREELTASGRMKGGAPCILAPWLHGKAHFAPLPRVVLLTLFYRISTMEKPTPNFSHIFLWWMQRQTISSSLGDGSSCCSTSTAEGKSTQSSPPTPPWYGDKCLHHHLHQHHHHHHHPPHSLCR
jgi:hypothetical protein